LCAANKTEFEDKKTAMIKGIMAADKNPTSKGDFATLVVPNRMGAFS
jgi:hypothetical protein